MANKTINEVVRDGLRVDTNDYADSEITYWIEWALEFLNAKTGETYTIADTSNANVSPASRTYDLLLGKLVIWQTHVELYKETNANGPRVGDGDFEHISTVFRREFFDLLAACYPGLVDADGGGWNFADKTSAGEWIAIVDSRYDDGENVRTGEPQ